MVQQTAETKLRPTDLATALDCSLPYASQILSGARKPNQRLAIRIYDLTGHKVGPLAGASEQEIELLRKFAVAA